jgi:hypothetical protein
MRDWISDLIIFSAGIAGGILFTQVKPYFRRARANRTAMVAARTRILADMKDRHNEEILSEAFRTADAIRGELGKSLQALRKTLAAALDPAPQSGAHREPIPLSDPIQPDRSKP